MPRYQPADSSLSPRFVGVPTFARLPLVDTLEDVDVAVVGVPFDTGVTYRVGGRFGPNAVRAASVDAPRPYNPTSTSSRSSILSCVDYGDVAIVPGLHRAQLRRRSRRRSRRSSRPASSRCSSAATTRARCPTCGRRASRGPVAVIDFDSHTDAWDSYFGEKYNHGTWMRRAIEEGLVDVAHSIEIGLRGSLYERRRTGPGSATSSVSTT